MKKKRENFSFPLIIIQDFSGRKKKKKICLKRKVSFAYSLLLLLVLLNTLLQPEVAAVGKEIIIAYCRHTRQEVRKTTTTTKINSWYIPTAKCYLN